MIWDAKDVKLLRESEAENQIASVALSGNGSVVCAVTKAGSIVVLDPASGSCSARYQIKTERPWLGDVDRPFMLEEKELSAVGLTESGKFAVIGAEDRSVLLWDLSAGTEIAKLTGHQYPVKAVAINRTGEWVITASGNALRIYHLPDESPLYKITERTQIASVSMSQQGDLGLSAAGKVINVWSTADGRIIGSLRGHSGRVSYVSLDPAGRFAISCSEDRTLRLWSLSDMSCLGLLNAAASLTRCACNVSHERILAGDSNGQLYFLQHVGAGNR
jgi:WD40 repeat protein